MPKGKKSWGGKLLRYLCKDSMDRLGACVDTLSTKSPAKMYLPQNLKNIVFQFFNLKSILINDHNYIKESIFLNEQIVLFRNC